LQPAFFNPEKSKLLLGGDRVFGSLGDAELHDGLGFDLNRLTGLGIASHTGLAMRFHQAAEAGDDEHAILFLSL